MQETLQQDKKLLRKSIKLPCFFVLILCLIKIIEYFTHSDWSSYGLMPKTIEGAIGILTAPFLHSDFNHLFSNILPIFILGVALFFFYSEIAIEIFIFLFLATGLWTWVFARPAYHIGASGVFYALASFLFFSGIIRKEVKLTALSALVVFLYGSIFWGIFPLKPEISWESHLMGFIAGIMAAFFYRKQGPQRKLYSWELEEDEEEEDENAFYKVDDRNPEQEIKQPDNV